MLLSFCFPDFDAVLRAVRPRPYPERRLSRPPHPGGGQGRQGQGGGVLPRAQEVSSSSGKRVFFEDTFTYRKYSTYCRQLCLSCCLFLQQVLFQPPGVLHVQRPAPLPRAGQGGRHRRMEEDHGADKGVQDEVRPLTDVDSPNKLRLLNCFFSPSFPNQVRAARHHPRTVRSDGHEELHARVGLGRERREGDQLLLPRLRRGRLPRRRRRSDGGLGGGGGGPAPARPGRIRAQAEKRLNRDEGAV